MTQDVMYIVQHSSQDEFLEFVKRLIDNPTDESLRTLDSLLLTKCSHTYLKHAIPKYVARVFLAWKEDGLRRLVGLLKRAPGHIYPLSILLTIYYASQKRYCPLFFIDEAHPLVLSPLITDEMAALALRLFKDFVIQSQRDMDLFQLLIGLLQQISLTEKAVETESGYSPSGGVALVFDTVAESTISLSMNTITEFSGMVAQELSEEEYQQFLTANPVLLDPLARRIIPKQKLGLEYVTDYVLEKLDGSYIVAEIEKPSDRVFTKQYDFTSRFIHALGQVLEFQEWIETNIHYAQTHLPGIVAPTGLLIIGRRSDLDERAARKLARLNTTNSGRVSVVCFDDIVDRAIRLYKNMYSR